MSNERKYRGEVIEIYPQEGKAAVRFSWRGRERVECVGLYCDFDWQALAVGTRGWMRYTSTPNMGIWGFAPFKVQS